jgi:glycosyltransferase involved in cell wall biosynthesis
MRIPYEGMLCALANPHAPLLISIWGNDFTLHARATPLMARYTRLSLRRAEALHTDCHRDLRMSFQWGFQQEKPSVVLPGAGGVQPELFYPPVSEPGLVGGSRMVINPRGFRAYVRNDTFFRAIPLVLEHAQDVSFICTTMADEPRAHRWVKELGIVGHVELLPWQNREQMAELFRKCRVVVSPSTHDGTPNTLLEAMACGCIPVASDLESVREWITPGINGLLFDPADPFTLSQVILEALGNTELRQRAHSHNLNLIAGRAAYPVVMEKARVFYQDIISSSR